MSVINTNVKSLVARDAMTINNRSLSTAMERLSTGKRINSAADDAAGLAIGTRMDAQIKGLNMAIKNANDTISVTQTAEGAMQEITSILQRMRELSVQSASDTNSAEDRAFLQQEVGQLSTEIDRISSTTQFNAMNLLDGSWANKTFQIGANRGQTMSFSIGSMKSNALGVASSAVGAAAPFVPADVAVTGATAQGTSAGSTTIKLAFNANDTYGFTLKDAASGLTGTMAATALDLSSSISKADFAKGVNKALKESALDTKVTGSVTALANTNIDTTPEATRFNISIGGGAVQNIDLGARLRNTVGVTTTAVTAAQINTALQAELQSKFDDSITVAAGGAAAAFVIQDAQGRSIELSQGSGNGAIFGTDSANNGALSAVVNPQNNLSVAWSGNDLLVTNKAGAETTLASFTTVGTSSVVFDASGSIPGQVQNPVTLVGAAFSDPKVTANGSTEVTQLAINFSNRSDTANVYKFKLTDGAGHLYADLSAGLDLGKDISNATIEAAVRTALQTQQTAGTGAFANKATTVNDFDVSFNGSTLNIKARDGLTLGVENFVSTSGTATVTPMNELSKSSLLASQNAYQSEIRLGVNAAAYTVANTTAGNKAGEFDIWIDGVKSAGTKVDITASLAKVADSKTYLEALATELQAKMRLVADVNIGGTTVKQDLSNILVTADTTTGQLVVKDSFGRAISLQASADNKMVGTGAVFLQDGVTGVANKVAQVKTASNVAKGGLYNVTKMDVSLSASKVTDLNFKLNGVALSATAWDSTQPFEGSAAQTNLNSMMNTLNGAHPDSPFEYSVSGNTISFTRRDGGELAVDTFSTAAASSAVTATITPAAGQGTGKVVNYNEALATAKATGTASVATSAKLKFNSPDLIGLSVSDGSKTYTMNSTALDISDRSSVNSFLKSLNKTLAGSNIMASMDLQGNLFLGDQLGGTVAVTGYSSAAGQSVSWTPAAGQGDALSIQSGFVGSAPAVGVPAGAIAVGGGATSVAQISITTQAGAANAIAVVDKALSYVNAERSKLGAIENRLTHTVDNLANIVTNTAASKSRIVDTDYATETTELARAQIIAQASTAMLAQANQSAQGVLSLLK